MMTIGSVKGTSNNVKGNSGMRMQTDSVSKNIQTQIANAQKRLQELSSNEDMELEEKMKKRQEIQQEITSLNQQLRQHEMEQRKQKQSKSSSMDEMLGSSKNAGGARSGGKGSGLSTAGMQAMISADSSIKQAQVQGSTAERLDGKASVLESEIKLDAGRGSSVERKEEELADIQKKAQEAALAQASELSNANQAMEDAEKTENGESNPGNADNNERKKEAVPDSTQDTAEAASPVQPKEEAASQAVYTPVDIRL